MVDLQPGAVVRVVLEGPVVHVMHDSTFLLGDGIVHYVYPTSEHVKAVEVIAPAGE